MCLVLQLYLEFLTHTVQGVKLKLQMRVYSGYQVSGRVRVSRKQAIAALKASHDTFWNINALTESILEV